MADLTEKDVLANKSNLREIKKIPESSDNGPAFLGKKPEGIPDDNFRNQVAPQLEVRCKKMQVFDFAFV